MLRGFRWQLIALFIATLAFGAGLVYRLSRQPTPQPTLATPAATIQPSPSAAPTSVSLADPGVEADAAPAFREGLVGAVQRLNPLFAHLNPPDRDISSLIFEGLFATNDYGEPTPRLAREMVVSGDGLEVVLRLRDDVLWQDGLPFSADDVVYTMSLLSDPAYAAYSPAAAFWRTVETQKLDDHLVRFRLAQPYGSFPHLLTIGLLPQHALRGTSVAALAAHPFNLSPIGTGAYQLASLRAASNGAISEVRLDLAPTFQLRPEAEAGFALPNLQFTMYADAGAALDAWRANQIDALAALAPPADLAALPASQLYAQVESVLGLLIFNWADDRFAERRMRQALSLSLDVPTLIATNFASSAAFADSPFIPGASFYQPDVFWTTFDPEGALDLLESVALDAARDSDASSSEPNGVLNLLVEDRAPLPGLAADMAAAWAQLGLDVAVDAVDSDALRGRLDGGDFDLAIVRQRLGGDPDLFRFWHPAQFEAGFNYGAAADTGIAQALEQARGEHYGFRRAELYSEFQTLFAEATLAIPLWYPVYPYVVRAGFSHIALGYLVSPADRFRNISEWRRSSPVS